MTPSMIKSLRKSLGMTQTQFYDKLGLKTSSPDAKRQTITRWENGTRNPSNAALALLNGLAQQISEDEWINRCFNRYKLRAGLSDVEAKEFALATFNEEKNVNKMENGPEEAADNDMECWEP